MNIKFYKIQARFLQIFILVVAVLTSSTLYILPSNDNNAIARILSEPYTYYEHGTNYEPDTFTQPIEINIDRPYPYNDWVGVIIYNDNNGAEATEFYPDFSNDPLSSYYIEGHIDASDGDTLITCVMVMSTEEAACDTKIASSYDSGTQFNVNMDNARSLVDYGVFDYYDVQEYKEKCERYKNMINYPT